MELKIENGAKSVWREEELIPLSYRTSTYDDNLKTLEPVFDSFFFSVCFLLLIHSYDAAIKALSLVATINRDSNHSNQINYFMFDY